MFDTIHEIERKSSGNFEKRRTTSWRSEEDTLQGKPPLTLLYNIHVYYIRRNMKIIEEEKRIIRRKKIIQNT